MLKNQNIRFNKLEKKVEKSLLNSSTKNYYQIFFHLIISIILFSPFFFGKFQMAGTDQYFNIFPNLFFGLREFNEFGQFSYWNPYIFSGFDMTESMHSHFLHPVFWPILLFHEKYIFHIVTAIFFLCNFGIAIFWIKISNFFDLKNFSSSAVAITAQSSFFFWFGTINFIGVHLFFFSTFIIYLLCSYKDRRYLANFSLFSLGFVCLFLTAHPGYVFGFTIVPIIFFIFLFFERYINRNLAFIFVGAIIFSLIIGLYRIFPIYLILDQGTISDPFTWSRNFKSSPFLILTLFNPSMFGNVLGDSLYFFETMNYPRGLHNAFHTSLYFGIGPLIIILTSIVSKFSRPKILLFISFILTLFYSTYFLEPIQDFINILFKPFTHSSIFKILCFYSFMFLFIFCLKDFSTKKLSIKIASPKILIISFITIFILSIGIYLDVINFLYQKEFQKFARLSEIAKNIDITVYLILCKLLIIFWLVYLLIDKQEWNLKKIEFLFKSAVLLTLLFYITTTLIGLYAQKLGFIFIQAESYFTYLKNFLLLLISLSTIYLYSLKKIKINKLIIFFMFIFIVSPYVGEKFTSSNIILSVHMSVLGWLGSLCILIFYLIYFKKLKNRSISIKNFMFIFLIIHFVDLSISFKNNSFVNIWRTPFEKNFSDIYPTSSGQNNLNLEKNEFENILKNFRVNQISILDGYTDNVELQSSFSILSKKMTYSGVDSIFPRDYYDFLNNFLGNNESQKLSRAGIIGNIKNERLLDLLGVKVDLDENKKVIIRPNPLPRFSSFEKVIYLNNNESLNLLKKDNYDFTKNLILNSKAINQNIKKSLGTKKYKKLEYKIVSNDHIKINIDKSYGRAVLFNDRYSKNWKAYWNQKKININKANNIFMGVLLPEGNGILEFKFEPKIFNNLKKTSKMMFYVTIVFLFFIFANRKFRW